jgi:hypothetical protein
MTDDVDPDLYGRAAGSDLSGTNWNPGQPHPADRQFPPPGACVG